MMERPGQGLILFFYNGGLAMPDYLYHLVYWMYAELSQAFWYDCLHDSLLYFLIMLYYLLVWSIVLLYFASMHKILHFIAK